MHFKYIPVRAICSVGWNLMELTVGNRAKMRRICYIKYSHYLTSQVSKC